MSNRFTRAMATRDAIGREHHRLYDQLDAIPEPDVLPACGGTSSMGEPAPRCWACRQYTETHGEHVNPETGDYDCPTPGTAA
jgi:hypothetical protein